MRVGVLTKAELEQSATRWAQGGVAAALGGDDSTDLHLADTLVDDFDLVDFLQSLSAGSVDILGAEAAGVMLADERGGLHVIASSDERMRLLELFWLPPGFTRNFLYELRTMLMEELDLVKEARFTDLFRRRTRKAGVDIVSAPRVHFALSSRDVLVLDFVSGVWVADILRAVEQHDTVALTALRLADIDPREVARRYLDTNRFGGFENVFFHADLHPANVVVQPGNKLKLVDFGSCGAFPRRELHVWRRLLDAQSHEDVGAMVQAALALLEPLPPIDVDEFQRRLEAVFWQDLYAIKSKESAWWERTSATLWVSFLKLAREYDVPMNLNTLRMIRATMLADTVAARLDHTIDPYKEYRRYERGAGRRTRRRLAAKVEKTLFSSRTYIRLEQAFDAGFSFVYRAQRLLDGEPVLSFAAQIGKAAYGLKLLFDVIGVAAVGTAAAALGRSIYLAATGRPAGLWPAALTVMNSPTYGLALLVVVLIAARRLHYRLHGKDENTRRRAA